ncbi:hypothetical protein [Streptomyces sp.]|uniref:hypothetical protein n=1 Tax=Streptomyces sp. TaxID=1931 RepID=UPI002D789233|nr:hypothetical protein [Streptomyces sp.]HET6353455.1 hypothetical protein [Streptomyces sp.]
MNLWAFAGLGAAGGLIPGLIDFYNHVAAWRIARRRHRGGVAVGEESPPSFRDHYDIGPDSLAAATHVVLGTLAALLFGGTGQIQGAYAAIVVGASAPILLTQLGRLEAVSAAVAGPEPMAPVQQLAQSSAISALHDSQQTTATVTPPNTSTVAATVPSAQAGRMRQTGGNGR